MSKNCFYLLCVAVLLCVGPNAAFAKHDGDDDHGKGHANGHERHGRGGDRDEDRDHGRAERRHYRDHDRELHDWYRAHHDRLPPGLAKRDELPPGLERQLVVRGTLPPGLQKKMHPCPIEVEQLVPPAPAGYTHMVIGGNIVLVNRKTFFVLDVFHFEM